MPKTIWKGQITVGLVNVPVGLTSATQSSDPKMRLVDRRDLSPVGYIKINKQTGREVRPDEIARAVEIDGETVVLDDDDLNQLDAGPSHTIDIRRFVRLEQIQAAYFDKPYFLAPRDGADTSYALLREVIRDTHRVGIARVVLRSRERLAALLVHDDVLSLNLLRFADEVRGTDELDVTEKSARELGVTTDAAEMAAELVNRMTVDWDPGEYPDQRRQELFDLVAQKTRPAPSADQPEAAAADQPQPGTDVDLAEQLRRTIERRSP